MKNKNWQIWVLGLVVLVLCGAFTYLMTMGIQRSLPQVGLPVSGVWHTSWESIIISVTVVLLAVFNALFPFIMVFSLFTGQQRERMKGDVWASLQRMNIIILLQDSMEFEKMMGKATDPIFSQNMKDEEFLAHIFARRFEDYYGPLTFTLPVLCFSFISFIGWMVVFFPNSITGGAPVTINGTEYHGFASMIQNGLVSYIRNIVEAGSLFTFTFLGAHFWSIQGLVRRYLNSDLQPKNFMFATSRILSSWIMALVLIIALPKAWVDPNQSWLTPILGFFTGIFTMRIVQWLWKTLIKNIKLYKIFTLNKKEEDDFGKDLKLTSIPGLNIFHADRLGEEGIENVDDLTSANLLDLLSHLRYPPNTIVDWVDKALLIRYASDSGLVDEFRKFGIQSASDLADVWHNTNTAYLTRAELLAAMKGKTATIKGIVTSLHRSSNFEHVYSYWEKTPQPRTKNQPVTVVKSGPP